MGAIISALRNCLTYDIVFGVITAALHKIYIYCIVQVAEMKADSKYLLTNILDIIISKILTYV
jgi:flagellin-specific chaperone FliS